MKGACLATITRVPSRVCHEQLQDRLNDARQQRILCKLQPVCCRGETSLEWGVQHSINHLKPCVLSGLVAPLGGLESRVTKKEADMYLRSSSTPQQHLEVRLRVRGAAQKVLQAGATSAPCTGRGARPQRAYLEQVRRVPATARAQDLVAVEPAARGVQRVRLEHGRVHVRCEDARVCVTGDLSVAAALQLGAERTRRRRRRTRS